MLCFLWKSWFYFTLFPQNNPFHPHKGLSLLPNFHLKPFLLTYQDVYLLLHSSSLLLFWELSELSNYWLPQTPNHNFHTFPRLSMYLKAYSMEPWLSQAIYGSRMAIIWGWGDEKGILETILFKYILQIWNIILWFINSYCILRSSICPINVVLVSIPQLLFS